MAIGPFTDLVTGVLLIPDHKGARTATVLLPQFSEYVHKSVNPPKLRHSSNKSGFYIYQVKIVTHARES